MLTESVSDIIHKFGDTVIVGDNIHTAEISINDEACAKCGLCSKMCRSSALNGKPPSHNGQKCTGCGLCVIACRKGALSLHKTINKSSI